MSAIVSFFMFLFKVFAAIIILSMLVVGCSIAVANNQIEDFSKSDEVYNAYSQE